MKFPRILLVCFGLLAALWLGAAQALPNVDEVQAAAKRGDYAGAEKMMREVIAAKPDSARGHYVLAEILAHERQFNEAAEHTRRARALDPAIKFTDPAKFSAFEQLIEREQAPAAKAGVPATVNAAPPMRAEPVERSSGGGVPIWLLIVGAGIFIWLAMRFMRNRTAAQGQPAMAGGYGNGAAPGGYGGYGGNGYGPGMQAPSGGGSGMLGVGLGVAGGVAAGMLAEKLMHEGRDDRSIPRDAGGGGNGLVPGSFDSGADSAGRELGTRDIDFGSGDGWGGGDAGGGGGDLGGGGGGSDDW